MGTDIHLYMEKYNEEKEQWEAVTIRDEMKIKGIKKAIKIMEDDKKMAIKSIFNGQKRKLLERLHLAENKFIWMNEERSYLAFAYLADVKNDWRSSFESLKIGGEFENETYNFSPEMSEDIKRWGTKGHSLVCYEDNEINEILNTLKYDNFQEENEINVLYMKSEIASFVLKYLIAPLSRIQKETDQKLRIIMFFDN
jgi:hypothetical protein